MDIFENLPQVVTMQAAEVVDADGSTCVPRSFIFPNSVCSLTEQMCQIFKNSSHVEFCHKLWSPGVKKLSITKGRCESSVLVPGPLDCVLHTRYNDRSEMFNLQHDLAPSTEL